MGFYKMVYCEASYTSGVAAPLNSTIGINNPFDPPTVGAGHQPMGWDQCIAFYTHYRCKGCKIEWMVVSDDPVSQLFCALGPTYDVTTAPFANYSGYEESPLWKTKVTALVTGVPSRMRMSQYFRCKDYYGEGINPSTQWAAVTSAPTEIRNAMCYVESIPLASNVYFWQKIKVTYYVEFRRMSSLGQS